MCLLSSFDGWFQTTFPPRPTCPLLRNKGDETCCERAASTISSKPRQNEVVCLQKEDETDVGGGKQKDFQYLHSTVRLCSLQCGQQDPPLRLSGKMTLLSFCVPVNGAPTPSTKEHAKENDKLVKTNVTFSNGGKSYNTTNQDVAGSAPVWFKSGGCLV